MNVVTHVNKLVVDSRATRHICANKSMLTSYTVAEDGEGKGKVLLKLTSRKTLDLNDVLHVPSIRVNLVFYSIVGNGWGKDIF